MKYIIRPMNEGHDMPCKVEFQGSKANAIKKAHTIAALLETHIQGNSFSVRVAKAGPNFESPEEDGPNLIVWPAGEIVDGKTGKFVKGRNV